jgi:two-component system CheB/CheR fusion protein
MNSLDSPAEQPDSSIVEGKEEKNAFLIVGIGASAGGLEAFTQLFNELPSDTGMAFILVQHLEPSYKSLLADLLQSTTEMSVFQVEDGMVVEPNCVYVIPPNKNMAIARGKLTLLPRSTISSHHMPIDNFFESLAKEQEDRAIGIILSGMGHDGALGMATIKASGGIGFVQNEESTEFNSMPRAAMSSSCVDFILPPGEIARELVNISRHPLSFQLAPAAMHLLPEDENSLSEIFSLLLNVSGINFLEYKRPTIQRRIMRRMILHQFQTLGDYVAFLREKPAEVQILFQDILINVTSFFRDPGSFAALKATVFMSLILNRIAENPIRIWIPGCSTGEEVYSIAICLLEFLEECKFQTSIKIFATDIHQKSIEFARTGIYTDKQIMGVSSAQQQRFFQQVEGGYQISKFIREMCVFAKQNVTQDPPFSKIDLISCRNVLIYLGVALQKKVMAMFHYALNPDGFLMLGISESTGNFSELFNLVDKQYKIYSRKLVSPKINFDFTPNRYALEPKTSSKQTGKESWNKHNLQSEADRIVLQKYAPPGVLVNEELEILQFRGQAARFLAPEPGNASLNLLKMMPTGLALDLRTAIHQAKKQNKPARKEGLKVQLPQQFIKLNIEVIPFKASDSNSQYFLVLFEELPFVESDKTFPRQQKRGKSSQSRQPENLAVREAEIIQLRQENAATKEYLQSMLVEQETITQELRAANEEILSSNEELQSTNEELETAKEEIQATNEELNTINEELQSRNRELSHLNDDMNNLLSSVSIPIAIIDTELRVRLVTPSAKKLLNIRSSDSVTLLSHINLTISISDLHKAVNEAVSTTSRQELEVQDQEGCWYELRILPYKTADNQVDGAVMILFDIHELKQSAALLAAARDYAEAIVETVRSPLIVLNQELRVQRANRAFYQTFQVTPQQIEQKFLLSLESRLWNISQLREHLLQVFFQDQPLNDFEIEYEFSGIGRKIILINACKITLQSNSLPTILLAIEDITERKQIENYRHQILLKEQQARSSAESASRAKDEFLSILSHELKNPLTAILAWAQVIRTRNIDPVKMQRGLEVIERSAKLQSRLIEDMLDVSRIVTGKLSLNLMPIDLIIVLRSAIAADKLVAETKGIRLETQFTTQVNKVLGDPDRLMQAIWNLLSNAIKFTPSGGQIRIELQQIRDPQTGQLLAEIQVSDNGIGIDPEFLPFVFDRFRQAESSSTRRYEGLGLGLALAQYIVGLHSGTISAASPGKGLGTTLTIRLPLLVLPGGEVDQEPLASVPEPEVAERAIAELQVLNGLQILLVENDVNTCELITAILEQAGATVTAVESSRAAIASKDAIAGQPLPDLLIVDIWLSGENGYDFIQHVRSLPPDQGGNIPAVALTAEIKAEDVALSVQAGFQLHISKPIYPGSLIVKIAHLMGRNLGTGE